MIHQTRVIKCSKLKREALGLTFVPYPGELGQTIYHTISAEAWNEWLNYLTILINEKRLDVSQADVKLALEQEMKQFLQLEHK